MRNLAKFTAQSHDAYQPFRSPNVKCLVFLVPASEVPSGVSRELGELPNALGTNSLVGYQIRLASETSKNTCLTFVTNGIALRMLEGGTGPDGQGTAFDEVTVSYCTHPKQYSDTFW